MAKRKIYIFAQDGIKTSDGIPEFRDGFINGELAKGDQVNKFFGDFVDPYVYDSSNEIANTIEAFGVTLNPLNESQLAEILIDKFSDIYGLFQSGTTTSNQLVNKSYVDGQVATKQNLIPAGTLGDIVSYSGTQGTVGSLEKRSEIRETGSTSNISIPTEYATRIALDEKLNLTGGTLTGDLVLASDPSGPMNPSTKQYTDESIEGVLDDAKTYVDAELLNAIMGWDAATNEPELVNPDLTKVGVSYFVTFGATRFSIDWVQGDLAVYNESGYLVKSQIQGAVTSVNTRTGAVTGLAEDNAVVHLAGTETVSGAKTFSSAATITGGLKDANVTTAVNLGDSGNTSASTGNKTILGAINELATRTSGGGVAPLPVYITNTASTVEITYNQLSYTLPGSQTILNTTVNNNEVLIKTFLFDAPLSATSIPAGNWNLEFYGYVDSGVGVTKVKAEIFVRASGGAETTLFTINSAEINNTSVAKIPVESFQNPFTILATDRLGMRLYANTTSVSDKVVYTYIGDGYPTYITTPLAMRHDLLRDVKYTNDNLSGALHITNGSDTFYGTKSFSSAPILSSLTASTVPYLDASKNVASSSVTPTELGYLSGVTSAIQTQINSARDNSLLPVNAHGSVSTTLGVTVDRDNVIHTATIAGNTQVIVNFPTASASTSYTCELHLTMGATLYTITWATTPTWIGDAPSFEANKTSVVTVRQQGTSLILGGYAGAY